MPLVYSRPKKLTHSDTVLYEIYMLRHTANKLSERLTGRDAWVHLEAFLVHFRNLIEFLGNDHPRDTDVHLTNVWGLEYLEEPASTRDLHERGKQLWERYEPRQGLRVSQYLHHCTTQRIAAKDWPVSEMMQDIEPLLAEVEKNLPKQNPELEPVHLIENLPHVSASVTVNTSTSPPGRNLK